MANRLTESRLKQIIREETARLTRRPPHEVEAYPTSARLPRSMRH
jgi:hypothetical protein